MEMPITNVTGANLPRVSTSWMAAEQIYIGVGVGVGLLVGLLLLAIMVALFCRQRATNTPGRRDGRLTSTVTMAHSDFDSYTAATAKPYYIYPATGQLSVSSRQPPSVNTCINTSFSNCPDKTTSFRNSTDKTMVFGGWRHICPIELDQRNEVNYVCSQAGFTRAERAGNLTDRQNGFCCARKSAPEILPYSALSSHVFPFDTNIISPTYSTYSYQDFRKWQS